MGSYSNLERAKEKLLKTCPFCGGKVYFTGGGSLQLMKRKSPTYYAVRCPKCNMDFGYDRQRGGLFKTLDEAVQAWNRRSDG